MALSDELHALADRVFVELEHPRTDQPQPAAEPQAQPEAATQPQPAAEPTPAEQVGATLERTFGPQDTPPPVPAGAEPAEPDTEGL